MDDQNQLKLSASESNEIILDIIESLSPSSSSPTPTPTIVWKVQNGSAIRSGEVLAQYLPACADHTSKARHDDENVRSANNSIGNNESSSPIATAAAANAASTDVDTTAQTGAGGGGGGGIKQKRPKIIRPKRRNLGMMNRNKKVTNEDKDSGDGSVHMEDLMKSFGRNKSKNTGSLAEKKNGKNEEESREKTNDGGHKNEILKIESTKSMSTSTGTRHEKWISIKAKMDGIVEIYSTVQRRTYRPLSVKDGGDDGDVDDDGDKQKRAKNTNGESEKKGTNINSKIVFVLGKIEPCQHPAVIDGLCAVCGQSVLTSRKKTTIRVPQSMPTSMYSNNTKSSNNERDEFTTAGGFTVSVTKKEAESSSKNMSKNLRGVKKLNLVLDLDHTLLHATADKRAVKWMMDDRNKDVQAQTPDLHVVLLPMMEGHPLYELQQQNQQQQSGTGGVQVWQPHYVKLRPHLADFISAIMDKFEITIYTAGTRTYAHKIADVISRHVLDHQNSKGDVEKEDPYSKNNGSLHGNGQQNKNVQTNKCLDEGELNDLRQRVSRLQERMRWEKSRKERQEYVKRMNEKFELEKKKEDASKGSDSMKDEDELFSQSAAAEKDTNEKEQNEETEKPKKRRRVTFTETVIMKDDAAKNDATVNEEKKQSIEAIAEKEEEDPSVKLDILKSQLATAEEREEAAQMLRKKIFGSRIYSRTDLPDLGRDVKSLKRISTCGGKMAAIVDDREDVWANADNNSTGRKGEPPYNLLLVKPYHFPPFLNFSDVNNASGKDLCEEKINGRSKTDSSRGSEENQLLWTGDILSRLHGRFYDTKLSEDERDKLDVPSILTEMRREVLSQCNPPCKVILSGLVPLYLQNFDSRNEGRPRHDVIRYAEELGAKVMTNISSDITHVIAAKDGTDKILQAQLLLHDTLKLSLGR